MADRDKFMQGIQDCGIRAYASCDGYGIHTNEQTMVEMDDIRANFLEELCQPSHGLGIQCPLIEEVEAVTEKQELVSRPSKPVMNAPLFSRLS